MNLLLVPNTLAWSHPQQPIDLGRAAPTPKTLQVPIRPCGKPDAACPCPPSATHG